MASDAVGLELISRIVGYKLTKGDFSNTTPNLPQRIAILAEANTANQGTVTTAPYRMLSSQTAGEKSGYGSPAHIMGRILFPNSGGGAIGGIPVWVYPQLEAAGAVSKKIDIQATGTATSTRTHYVVVDGRTTVDGGSYAFVVQTGDTGTVIATKIYNTINNVLACPGTCSVTSPLSDTTKFTTKWSGLTANDVNIYIETGGNDAGIVYSVSETEQGAGTPSVSGSLSKFGNEWNTIVINSYGFVQSVIDELQSYNGIPDPINPTGRFAGIIFKPFIALTGTVLDTSVDTDDTAICDAESAEVTIAGCPAPLSKGLPMEAAANYCTLYARISQDAPQLDIEGRSLPDMPIATGTFAMEAYSVRDAVVKLGMSTVDRVAGRYQVQDFVTTYHPAGEVPPQFRYCRNMNLDNNVRYGYYLLEQTNVVDHVIATDDDIVTASQVIKPKQWKGIVQQYAVDLGRRALIADVPFMQDSVTVDISSVNPDRLETFFRYKRTGVARILSTTAEAGFNFGTV